jgi:DNA-binding transcriptional LysR family regulator
MLDWDDLRYFLAVHRAGTLARAGSSLRINPTTVGRRLAALEERIGARLFDRTNDGYVATQAGRDLVARAERMEDEALAVEREVSGADQRLAGVVRLSATEMLATRFITPHMHRFAARHPEIAIDLSCTPRSVSLTRREADVVLRLAKPEEPSVVTRRLTSIELALYASRGYLAKKGTPRDAERSLRGHDVVLFAESRAFAIENTWFDARLDGARVVMRSDSVSSIYSATVYGLGVALLPIRVAEREAELLRIPSVSAPAPRVVWQAVHADLQRSARVRAVLEFLSEIVAEPG